MRPLLGASEKIPPTFTVKSSCCVCGGEAWVCPNAVGEVICPRCFNNAAVELAIPVDGTSYDKICKHAMRGRAA